jgi:hypothetical protein
MLLGNGRNRRLLSCDLLRFLRFLLRADDAAFLTRVILTRR